MNKLKEKIFDMSNSQLPLDKFYNDILYNTDINYDKVNAFKDLERIADYIINMQKDNAKLICKVDNFNNERLEMLDDIMELLKNNMKHFAEMAFRSGRALVHQDGGSSWLPGPPPSVPPLALAPTFFGFRSHILLTRKSSNMTMDLMSLN